MSFCLIRARIERVSIGGNSAEVAFSDDAIDAERCTVPMGSIVSLGEVSTFPPQYFDQIQPLNLGTTGLVAIDKRVLDRLIGASRRLNQLLP